MERLTGPEWSNRHYHIYANVYPKRKDMEPAFQKIVDRLGRYEDTGLKITETVTHWMYLPKLPEEPAITHNEESRSCENCGNIQCANSPIAYHWDECVDTNFTKHWIPKPPKEEK